MTTYNKALKAIIGNPTLEVEVSNPFPMVGEEVSLKSQSKWVFSHQYKINDGINETEESITPTLGVSSKTVTPLVAGEFQQKITVQNVNKSVNNIKYLRPIAVQTSPYFDIEVSKEIVRNDGETTQIIISPEFGYDFSRGKTIVANVFKENASEPFMSLSETDFVLSNGVLTSNTFSLDDRGVYDIEVTITDLISSTSTTRKINKLITVTPKLGDKAAAIKWDLMDGVNWFNAGNCPPGSTVILSLPTTHVPGEPVRLYVNTAKASWENPTIFTIDQDVPLVLEWFSWQGIWVGGSSEHVVFDGRGYQNIEKGIKLYNPDAEGVMGIQGDCSELEIFEVEIDTCSFAGVSLKHDPEPDNPDYWYDNFKYNRFLFHHNVVHDTGGEGLYIGYFGTGFITKTNSAGETVTYRPHHMYNCRIYRNELYDIGFDGIQFNNGINLEICYNYMHNIAFNNVIDQTSGFSMTFSGKVYNNLLTDYSGPCMQFGIMGETEIYNNIFTNPTLTGGGFYAFSNAEPPSTDPSSKEAVDIPLVIHNNFVMSRGTAFSARATNTWTNVKFIDNYAVYYSSKFSTHFLEYIILKGNIFHQLNHNDDLEFEKQDESYKFGDSARDNLLIHPTSPLCFSGSGDFFDYDIRGYKNWYSSIFPSGGYIGLYKDPSIVDGAFQLYSVVINGGDSSTVSRLVSVTLNHRGSFTKYRVSESPEFLEAEWQDYTADTFDFEFSEDFGTKTIYAQIANDEAESIIKSDTIEYIESPLNLDSIVIAQSYVGEVRVSFSYTGSTAVTKYRIGTSSNLSSISWSDYTGNPVSYAIDTSGSLTLYAQLSDASGNVSEIVSGSVTFDSSKFWIKFKDPKFEAAVASFIDTNKDGGITEAEAQTEIVVQSTQEVWNSVEVFEWNKLKVFCPGFPIPSSTKEIYLGYNRYAYGFNFNGVTTLEKLDLTQFSNPNTQSNYLDTIIFGSMCKGCTNLKSVSIKPNTTKILQHAFAECSSLETFPDIPDTCTSIGGSSSTGYSFGGCSSLKSIVVGSGVTEIFGQCFAKCTSMVSFYIKATTPPTLSSTLTFQNNTCNIYVPVGSGAAYKAATNWSSYASRIFEYDFGS